MFKFDMLSRTNFHSLDLIQDGFRISKFRRRNDRGAKKRKNILQYILYKFKIHCKKYGVNTHGVATYTPGVRCKFYSNGGEFTPAELNRHCWSKIYTECGVHMCLHREYLNTRGNK